MAKRFTDTEKWSHAWFRKLSPKFKCAWSYLLDKCDHAGIWIEDFEAMSFNIGEQINPTELENAFQGKIKKIGDDRYLIDAFIEFQYGKLNPNNKVHRSVIDKLEKIQAPSKELASPIQGAKDKDKEKDKDKVKEKEKEESPKITPEKIITLFNNKLAGTGKIKHAPFFLPSGLIEDFKIITGFKEFQSLETWENYFNLVAQSDFLTKEFTPSLAWLLKSDNAFKVLSGQYQNKEEKKKAAQKIPEHLEANARAWASMAFVELRKQEGWYGDTDFDMDVLKTFGDLERVRSASYHERVEVIQELKNAYFKNMLKEDEPKTA
jgi:hypothetical protein